MKALLAGLFLLCFAAARNCPNVSPGKGGPVAPTAILPFYKYSYALSKETSGRELHLYMDVDDISVRQNQTLWMRVTSDSTTANSVDLNVKINLNSQSDSTATNWFDGDLLDGDDDKTIAADVLGVENSTDRIYFDFYPSSCTTCRESIDFSVEAAWLDSTSPRVWGSVKMVDDLRTIVFDEPEGGYVNFYADFAAGSGLWTSVVFPGTLDQKSEVVLYWNEGSPATADNYLDMYPMDGAQEGNYLASRPFVVATAGRYWLSTYVKDAAGVGNPEFTIKVGFNEKPCSGAVSTVASSFLLALIPLTLLFSRA